VAPVLQQHEQGVASEEDTIVSRPVRYYSRIDSVDSRLASGTWPAEERSARA
jgi:hypothetical protein